MRRDKAINIFLFFVLTAVLFVCFFPVYFSFGEMHVRTVDLSERLFSLLFVLGWLSLCVYAAWKKKLYLLMGGAAYAVLAYIPGWFLPLFQNKAGSSGILSIIRTAVSFIFERIFELVNAPMVGISILFSEKTSVSLSKWLLPVLLLSYAGTQIVRYYRNAYLADQLHLEDTAYYPNPELAREIASLPTAGNVPVYRNTPSAPPSDSAATSGQASDATTTSTPAASAAPVAPAAAAATAASAASAASAALEGKNITPQAPVTTRPAERESRSSFDITVSDVPEEDQTRRFSPPANK